MLGIVFIYWIWKAFSDLALEFDKNKWIFFFIGIGSYYGTTMIAGVVVGVVLGLLYGFEYVSEADLDTSGWNVFFVLLGGLGCYGTYKFLENKLQKERELNKKEGIENIGVLEDN